MKKALALIFALSVIFFACENQAGPGNGTENDAGTGDETGLQTDSSRDTGPVTLKAVKTTGVRSLYILL
jgi:hypothetical protein